MELKEDYFRLTFTNASEYFVESDVAERETFLKKIVKSGVFGGDSDYITLRREESEPIAIRADKLFSVQKVNKSMIGAQTKVWRLV